MLASVGLILISQPFFQGSSARVSRLSIMSEFTSTISPPTGALRSETAFTDSISPKVSPWSISRPTSGRSQ